MAYIRHITLTANTVNTQTLPLPSAENYSQVEILNRNGTDAVYVSYDGTNNPANPTVGGNDFDVVPAATGAWIKVKLQNRGTAAPVIKLISASATQVSVKAIA